MKTNKDQSTLQQKSTVILVVTAAFLSALSITVITKAVEDFGEYRELNQNESEVLERYETNLSNLEALEDDARELEDATNITADNVLPLLPLRYHPSADLAMLESLINQSQARIADMSVIAEADSGPAGDGLTAYLADITVVGSYDGVKEFLANIDDSAKPLIAEEVQLTAAGGDVAAEVIVLLHHQGQDGDFPENDVENSDDNGDPDDIDVEGGL